MGKPSKSSNTINRFEVKLSHDILNKHLPNDKMVQRAFKKVDDSYNQKLIEKILDPRFNVKFFNAVERKHGEKVLSNIKKEFNKVHEIFKAREMPENRVSESKDQITPPDASSSITLK